ncbi:hypothetical protein GCM10029976_025920 [Kribbella albertanoniae]|uniref:Uncharacterized protein n=1 Tax=Kribbella albertanoniae TaxID=1266829 RepID=A0A4R4P1U7_9ACTN|nr:hypothetical protein [Kribbella albertanoniae]TDC15544.1 hypothetical protein E1261_40290 [Kribbella albertanoniae]
MQPVPRWAYRLAHAIPFFVLPSSLWRIGLVFGSSMGMIDETGQEMYVHGFGPKLYVVGLSLFSEALALTSLGLVQRWGEIVPRWIPLIGGRPVPPYAAIIPATLGGLSLIALWTYAMHGAYTDSALNFTSTPWQYLMVGSYSFLHLWGPSLLLLTWAYHRRRKSHAGANAREVGRTASTV